MEFDLKKKTPAGMCPVKWCRRCQGDRKRFCDRHHQQQWRSVHPVKAAFAAIRQSARKRRLEFSLSLAEFISVAVANGYLEGKGNTRYALHVDRKDNSLGYVSGNIQLLTCSENVRKENRRRFVAYFQTADCPF